MRFYEVETIFSRLQLLFYDILTSPEKKLFSPIGQVVSIEGPETSINTQLPGVLGTSSHDLSHCLHCIFTGPPSLLGESSSLSFQSRQFGFDIVVVVVVVVVVAAVFIVFAVVVHWPHHHYRFSYHFQLRFV